MVIPYHFDQFLIQCRIYMFTYLAALDSVLQIFIFFRNQDQITLLVIVHLQFVLPNYGTISPLTLRTVVLYLPLRQHWKLIFSQVLLLMTCSVFLYSRVFWLFYLCFWYCIDFSCSFVLLFVAQWAAFWRILALYKFPYYYYYYYYYLHNSNTRCCKIQLLER